MTRTVACFAKSLPYQRSIASAIRSSVGLWKAEAAGSFMGETLFHGSWWRIAHRHGPFDVVFLPINAPLCNWTHLQPPSAVEATLTPEQAAIAASILGTRLVVPIHYGSLNKPGRYVETLEPVARLERKAAELGLEMRVQEPGEWLSLD